MVESHVRPARFAPRATREMAGMFDDVSGRYDLLNRLMSLGQDRAWRAALWRAVPEEAHTVLDLCTGSGASLAGLRRPGRLVLGVDVSRHMLSLAASRERATGWAPRLVCADAFRLPLGDGSVDAVTIAFGMRNLRPSLDALRELSRVLHRGGTLAVLEAKAPHRGPVAPLHRFYLRRLVPLAGRLSRDPTAYAYLSRSIFEFGTGSELESELAETGFELIEHRAFLLGATGLWVARRRAPGGQIASIRPPGLQNAVPGPAGGSRPLSPDTGREREWRLWVGVQLALSAALAVALAYGLWVFANSGAALPLATWQRRLAWGLLGGGLVLFGARTVVLLVRFSGPMPRP